MSQCAIQKFCTAWKIGESAFSYFRVGLEQIEQNQLFSDVLEVHEMKGECLRKGDQESRNLIILTESKTMALTLVSIAVWAMSA